MGEHLEARGCRGGGHPVDQLQFPMRLQQAGVRADGMHMHPVQGLGGGDQRIGHGAGRKVDDQVVDGIARSRSTTSRDRMSAPTVPSATATDPRLPGRSASCRRSRYDGTSNTVAQVRHSRPLGYLAVSAISRDEVAHLARLARLALTDAELDGYAGQLDAILGHVSQISAVSTDELDEVDATSSPLDAVNVTRPDVIAECLTPEEALAAAPRVAEGRFAVPQILGEEE